MKKTIVLYTHDDMSDMWHIFFGQAKKYLSEFEFIILTNKFNSTIPQNYTQLYYNQNDVYTSRIFSCLMQINISVFLFIHEDMILINQPHLRIIDKLFHYVEDGYANSVKLIKVGSNFKKSPFDPILVSNEFSKFSIQPTIISKQYLQKILKRTGKLNIWDFEYRVLKGKKDYMIDTKSETLRGQYHYDSEVFPYIATAINKGKWNFSEYKVELSLLFKEYEINENLRGII